MSQIVDRQWTRRHGTLLLAVSIDPREIGRRIKKARDAKRWTQLDFASEASVSPSTVQRWEAGKLPAVRELIRVADILGVEAEWLVEPPLPDDERPQQAALIRATADGVGEILEHLGRIERHLGLPEAGSG